MTELSPPSDLAARLVNLRQFRPASAPEPANGSGAAPPRFEVINLDDIEIGDDPIWMIEGLLPSSGFGIVFGPPKSGKSFLISDALFHVALGRSWAGRSVKQGAVLYITGEGIQGFKRRLVGMRRHYGVEGCRTPFGLIAKAPDFGHRTDDAAELVATVRAWLATVGNPPLAAIAIDTLARAMKGADENTAKDMSVFVDNCGLLEQEFNCLVVGVHHAGKDVARGSRGSNALDGAVDVMWAVEKGDAFNTACIFHMKDGEEGLGWQFRLAPYLLREATATQGAISTCVVEIACPPQPAERAQQDRNKSLGDQPKLLLAIVREALGEAGTSIRGNMNVPHDVRAMAREDLKRYLPLKGYWDDDKPANQNRAVLSRDLKTLAARKYIGLTKDHLWLLGGGQS